MANPILVYEHTGHPVLLYEQSVFQTYALNVSWTGSDGDTTATDNSPFAHNLVSINSAEIDDAEFVTPPTSAFLPIVDAGAASAGVSCWKVPAHTYFDATFLNGDWTMATWWRTSANFSGYKFQFSWFSGAFLFVEMFYFKFTGSPRYIFAYRSGAPAAVEMNFANTFTTLVDSWHYVEYTKTGNFLSVYVNDETTGARVQIGSSTAFPKLLPSMGSINLCLGAEVSSGLVSSPPRDLRGWLDDTYITANLPRTINLYSR